MRGKIKYLIMASITVLGGITPPKIAEAESCPDLRVVFARGSGGERWVTKDYLEYKTTIENKLKTTSLKYEFIDLDYTAIGIGFNKLDVTLGAYVGSGDKYAFGESVDDGVKKLLEMINSSSCSNTKYVIGGYSQGAMVVSKALPNLNPERIIYAATFGDPKIYLPEGKGLIPDACRNKNLSDYRMYVPDCQAYKGLLGAYEPYEPDALVGKVGTWCNGSDMFCSSHLGVNDHLTYDSDGLFEDASKVIFDKITKHFGLENHLTSPHDTLILLDSTASMSSMVEEYKNEALRLAEMTLESGGRVALYDYRDLDDYYNPVEHCNFETCTIEVIQQKLNAIEVAGGGDTNESLLSASFNAMKTLKWQFGATKSVVVLTDAPFLLPDRDGVTLDDVVKLSKEIDPVNFYIVTNSNSADYYNELAEKTDGAVVTSVDELSLLTNYILERYDSLPRVEETHEEKLPTLVINEATAISDSEYKITFTSSSDKTIIILNDEIMGVTELDNIAIGDLKTGTKNHITLVPISDNLRGEGISIVIDQESTLKAPNTGRK